MTVDEYRIAQLYMIQVILMSDYYLVFCNRLGGSLLFRCQCNLACYLHGLFGVVFVYDVSLQLSKLSSLHVHQTVQADEGSKVFSSP